MPTECTPDSFGFEAVEGREVVAAFDGGAISSDAGALLLGATDRAINMMDRFCKLLSRRAAPGADRAYGSDTGRPAGVWDSAWL
jgi:hypothetical protein